MPWSSSDRRVRLPKDWHRRRAIAKKAAGGQCQWVTEAGRCPSPGTDCDHIDRTAGDEPTNLQWLCRTHHNTKTQGEAQAARASRKRPTQRHPGLI